MCTIPQDCWGSGQLAYWRPRWSSTVLSTLVGVTVTANSTYPLLVIVTCSNSQLTASVSEVFAISSEGLQVQPSAANCPDQFFVFPNSTGAVHPKGEYEITVSYRNQTLAETVKITVSILTVEDSTLSNQPYFTDSPRYVNVS